MSVAESFSIKQIKNPQLKLFGELGRKQGRKEARNEGRKDGEQARRREARKKERNKEGCFSLALFCRYRFAFLILLA